MYLKQRESEIKVGGDCEMGIGAGKVWKPRQFDSNRLARDSEGPTLQIGQEKVDWELKAGNSRKFMSVLRRAIPWLGALRPRSTNSPAERMTAKMFKLEGAGAEPMETADVDSFLDSFDTVLTDCDGDYHYYYLIK